MQAPFRQAVAARFRVKFGHFRRFLAAPCLSLFVFFAFSAVIPASIPTKGSGAADLIRKAVRRSSSAPVAAVATNSAIGNLPSATALPKLLTRPAITNTFYFAATAVATNGLESDYSAEVSFTTTNRRPTVTLAWDPSPGTNYGLRYNVYYGRSTRTYTNVTSAGTNLTLTLTLYAPPLTNVLLTVTTTGTNLVSSAKLTGPWTKLNATSLTLTNPAGTLYYRGLGTKTSRVQITKTPF